MNDLDKNKAYVVIEYLDEKGEHAYYRGWGKPKTDPHDFVAAHCFEGPDEALYFLLDSAWYCEEEINLERIRFVWITFKRALHPTYDPVVAQEYKEKLTELSFLKTLKFTLEKKEQEET